METPETFKQRVLRHQQIAARLERATARLEEAQQERLWAMVAAKEAGLSLRQIAQATGLSATRVHQLLHEVEANQIPAWLSALSDPAPGAGATVPLLPARVAEEVAVLRRCLDWLERLEREETVVVNLRPDADAETEFVGFDRPRVLRVLARIAADLDHLTGPESLILAETSRSPEEARRRHREQLAEPEPVPPRRSPREERAALREELGLPREPG
jgi:DNA-binding IclR family transcriptional regulator